jgi:tRNA-binding protein
MEGKVKATVSFDDFQQVDIRVGTIVLAQEFPKARKPAYRLEIDFGPLGIKQSSAQITALYRPEELLGRQVLAVVNFEPRQVADFMSEVLVLGLVGDAEGVVLLTPDQAIGNGSPIG